ncbi:MAG TPA: DUF2061 domain-containing protein [Caulobacteraceae bacterium]|nr:DUF2061 domain-containing protein [Caulobacteraceae bacterium]
MSSTHTSTETPPAAPPPLGAKLGGADSHGRALAKAVTWRAIGTLDTFVWSLLITGHASWASAIAATEIGTKIFLFYLHERVWRLLPWAPNARLRSLIKAVSWRFFGSLDTFVLSMIFTGNAKYAVSIATAEALTKIALYYVHERLWRLVKWGRLDAAPTAV